MAGTSFDAPAGMPSTLVTCPESAHLERIDYEVHPLGMLVTACTRFSPACAVTCGRICAARLDQKRRLRPDFLDEDDTVTEEHTLVTVRLRPVG